MTIIQKTVQEIGCGTRNQLREDVKNVRCLVVFYDAERNPID